MTIDRLHCLLGLALDTVSPWLRRDPHAALVRRIERQMAAHRRIARARRAALGQA